MVTHDLRSPLTGVKGGTQLLQRRGPLDERSERTVAGILSQVDQMERFIDDLVMLVRLESGEFPLLRDCVDLVDLVRDQVRLIQEQTDHHHGLRVDVPGSAVVGMWDCRRLGQVVHNLLTNAVKYSPTGGNVQVRVAVVADGAEVALLAPA